MIRKPISWYSTIGWFCFFGDGITGLMLLASPLFALKMMGVEEVPTDPVYIRYIGVFVMCAGLFYAVPRFSADEGQRLSAWQTVFVCTGVLRVCIALFVTWAMWQGLLGRGWSSVPVYDITLALIQFWLLWRTAAA